MNEKELRLIFREILGITYPLETLRRRLLFLTKKETDKVNQKYNKIEEYLNDIDEIISYRAEIKNDKWP